MDDSHCLSLALLRGNLRANGDLEGAQALYDCDGNGNPIDLGVTLISSAIPDTLDAGEQSKMRERLVCRSDLGVLHRLTLITV
jgi:hypothetical protein